MTSINGMHHNMLRIRNWFQPVAFMPLLSAALFPTLVPKSMLMRLFQSITRRRLAAVVTVLVQPCFQFLDPGYQPHEQPHYRFFSLAVAARTSSGMGRSLSVMFSIILGVCMNYTKFSLEPKTG
jgi:hypothetical protein